MVYKPRLLTELWPREVLHTASTYLHTIGKTTWVTLVKIKRAFCSIRDLMRMWIWDDLSFLRDNFRRKISYFIFRHIWGTQSRKLNSNRGTASPNPFMLDLSCKPQSLMWTDTGQIKEPPSDTPRVHRWHSYSYRIIQSKNWNAFENRLANQLVTVA